MSSTCSFDYVSAANSFSHHYDEAFPSMSSATGSRCEDAFTDRSGFAANFADRFNGSSSHHRAFPEYTVQTPRFAQQFGGIPLPGSPSAADSDFHRDFLLGRKFFEYVCSELAVFAAGPDAPLEQLEVKYTWIIDEFPYSDALDKIHAMGPTIGLATGSDDQRGDYEALMYNIGVVIRKGNEGVRNRVTVEIRQCVLRDLTGTRRPQVPPMNGPTSPRPSMPFPSFFESRQQTRPFPAPRVDLTPVNTQRRFPGSIDWVSKLNLWDQAQKTRTESNYMFRQLDNGEHIAQVNVAGSGRVYQGIAKRKAEAKQKAAMEACEALRLRIE